MTFKVNLMAKSVNERTLLLLTWAIIEIELVGSFLDKRVLDSAIL